MNGLSGWIEDSVLRILDVLIQAAEFEGWGMLLVVSVALLVGLIGLITMQRRTPSPREQAEASTGETHQTATTEQNSRKVREKESTSMDVSPDDWPAVAEATGSHRGDVIVGFLQDQGIEARCDVTGGGGFGSGQVVRVHPRDESRARTLLEERDL